MSNHIKEPHRNLKIKLIYPPVSRLIIGTLPPYGMGVIASFLRKNGYEVNLEDLSVGIKYSKCYGNLGFHNILKSNIFRNTSALHRYLSDSTPNKKIEKFMEESMKYIDISGYDLIGFSIFSYFQLYPALLMAKCLKKIDKDIPIVFGGTYTSLYWSLFFNEFKFVDYLIKGEGEIPLLRLINYLEGKINITEIPSLIYRNGERIYHNEIDYFKVEGESMPDFAGLPLDLYKVRIGKYKAIILPYRMSKGCINRCNFCVPHGYSKFETKSINKVISELRTLTRRYETNFVLFCDYLVNFSYRYMEKFCNTLIESGFHIYWGGYATVDNIDKRLLLKMKQAGCSLLLFGIESGSNRVLKNMGKGHTAKKASEILKDSYYAGINNVVSLMAGYPHETMDDVKLTVRFIKDNAKYIYYGELYEFKVLLNSPIYTNPEMFGIHNIRRVSNYILHECFSFDEINGLKWKEKKKQQKRSFRIVYFAFYRKILTKLTRIDIISTLYQIVLFLEKKFISNYSYRLLNYFMLFLLRRIYSSFYNSRALDTLPTGDTKKRLNIFGPKILDFYVVFVRTKNCEGLLATFKFLVYTVVSLIFQFQKMDMGEFSLKEVTQNIKPKIPVEIKKAGPDDYDMLKKIYGPLVLKNRLKRGDVCIVAVYDGLIVSSVWLTSKNDYIFGLEKEIRLKKSEVYGLGLYTHPLYRRLGIGTAVIGRRNLEAKKMGYEKVIAASPYGNIASQRLHERLGFQQLERITYLKILGFKKYWVQ